MSQVKTKAVRIPVDDLRKMPKEKIVGMYMNMFSSAGVNANPKIIGKRTKGELITLFQNISSLVSRSALQSALGQTFGGARDLYNVLGWHKELTFIDYLAMYERNGMAARVVDAVADESWRLMPTLSDGDVKGDDAEATKTDFLVRWDALVDKLDLQAIFNELDVALGISRYAVIFIGAPGEDYNQPLTETSDIAFLKVLDEGQITMSDFVTDIRDVRYGLPIHYSLQFDEKGMSVPVHWTRVIHCKQGRGRSQLYGVPSLQKSFNYLSDLEKIVGSSSEAFWLLIRKGIILTAQDGKDFPSVGTPEYNTMQDEISEFENQLRRVLRLKGVDVSDLGSQVVDGRGQHDLLIADIAASIPMPQRILIGSERGELASTSDDQNWADTISARQKKTCDRWLKQFVRRMIELGVLPQPQSGKWSTVWADLYQTSKLEKAQIAQAVAAAVSAITGGAPESAITIEDFMHLYLDYVMKKNVAPAAPVSPDVTAATPTQPEGSLQTPLDASATKAPANIP